MGEKELKKQKTKTDKEKGKGGDKKKEEKTPAKPVEKKPKSQPKLVLTNQNKGPKKDFSKFTQPGTFPSQYAAYQIAT